MRTIIFLVFWLVPAYLLQGQGLVYLPEGIGSVRIMEGRFYADSLRYDLYLPSPDTASPPLVVFVNGSGADFRIWDGYRDWARAVAASGMAALLYETRYGHALEDSRRLMEHLARKGTAEVDRDRLFMWMASGNTDTGYTLVMEDSDPRIRGASLYYPGFNLDYPSIPVNRRVPLEVVRAGKDNYSLNRRLDAWLAFALEENIDFTLRQSPAGRHAFDLIDAGPRSELIIRGSLEFMKATLHGRHRATVPGITPYSLMKQLRRGEVDRAETAYRTATENLTPEDRFYNGLFNSSSLIAMTEELAASGRREEALLVLGWALESNPQHPAMHNLAASVFEQAGERPTAVMHAERALELLQTYNHPNLEYLETLRKEAREHLKRLGENHR